MRVFLAFQVDLAFAFEEDLAFTFEEVLRVIRRAIVEVENCRVLQGVVEEFVV